MSAFAALRSTVVALIFVAAAAAFASPASASPSGGAVPVSPGAVERSTPAASACPTFSWTAVEGAAGYELAVFLVTREHDEETIARRPSLQQSLPAGATSWTPPADRCLDPGGRYAWSVRAHGADAEWSEAARFEIVGGGGAPLAVGPDAGTATTKLGPGGGDRVAPKLATDPRLSVSGDVVAAGDYTFTAPRTVRIAIPVDDFVVFRSDDDEAWWLDSAGYAYISSGTLPFDLPVSAALDLPNGATVKQLGCAYYDNWDSGGGAGNLTLIGELSRRPRDMPFGEAMGSIFTSSSGTSTEVQMVVDDTIGDAVVDNELYEYRMTAQMQTDVISHHLRFYGCEVFAEIDRLSP